MTPFQALYEMEHLNITIYVLGSTSDDLINKYMLHRDEVLSLLKFNLAKAQNRMKDSTNKWKTNDQFN